MLATIERAIEEVLSVLSDRQYCCGILRRTFLHKRKMPGFNQAALWSFEQKTEIYIDGWADYLLFTTAVNTSSISPGAPEIFMKVPMDKSGKCKAILNLPWGA